MTISLGVYGSQLVQPVLEHYWTPDYLEVDDSLTSDPNWQSTYLWYVAEDANGKYVKQVLSSGLNGATYGAAWVEHGTFVDVDVVTEVFGASDSINTAIGPAIRMGGATDGYQARFSSGTNKLELYSQNAGDTTNQRKLIGSANLAATPSYLDVWKIRLQAIGHAVKAKAWLASELEPEAWAIEVEDSTHAAGYVGVAGVGRGTNSRVFRSLRVVNLGDSAVPGVISRPGDGWEYHTFTLNESFGYVKLNSVKTVEYLIVGGGGGGGSNIGGGGGGGAFRTGFLNNLPAGRYYVTVGPGGAGSSSNLYKGANGSDSSFNSIVSRGGGGAGTQSGGAARSGSQGGSGGGAGGSAGSATGGSGWGTHGNAGGSTIAGAQSSGGGGGANSVGESIDNTDGNGGNGGNGSEWPIGSGNYYSGGGGGAGSLTQGVGGLGGGATAGDAAAATPNTGGGGGGSTRTHASSLNPGGSGIVIARYTI